MALPNLGLGTQQQAPPALPDLGIGSRKPSEDSSLPNLGLGKQEAGLGEKFVYGMATTPSFSEGIGDWLERRFPLGRFEWYNPGEGYHFPRLVPPPSQVVEAARQKNYKLAKAILDKEKQYRLEDATPHMVADPSQQGGGAETAGSIAAVLMDPLTLVPIGQSARVAYAAGGLIGAADAAAYGLSMNDEIDPVMTAMGATGGIVGTFGARYLGGKLSRMMQSLDDKSYQSMARKFEDTLGQYRSQGMHSADAYSATKKALNLNEDGVAGLMMRAGRDTGEVLDTAAARAEQDVALEGVKDGLRNYASKMGIPEEVSGISKVIDDYLGTVSTRIKNISPEVWGRLRKLDFAEHHNTHQNLMKAEKFVSELRGLKKTDKTAYRQLHLALLNQDRIAADKVLNKAGMTESYKSVRTILDDLGGQLEDAGYDMNLLDSYFPRVIKDVPKLMKALPGTERSMIEKGAKEAGVVVDSVDDLGTYINQYLRGRLKTTQIDQVIGASKGRKVDKVTEAILEHYAEPEAALHSYIRRATHDIERRKFFGRTAVNSSGGADIKVADSVGQLIAEGRQNGTISPNQMDELRELLVARFDLGNRTGYAALQGTRNLMYMSTIGNPVSALTQIGDIGVSAYAHGLLNTLQSVFGRRAIRAADLGIEDIAQEFASTLKTAQAMEWVFRKSMFKAVDGLGKNTSINAALRKWTKAVQTPKGIEALRKKAGPIFVDEFDSLVNDLANDRISENVKMLLFHELSELQPISLSEMPLKYLQNPNGRIFYMLKTFTLKQLDLLRRSIWQEARTGSKRTAMLNAAKYLGTVNLFNLGAEMSKEAVLTGEIDVDAVPDMFVSNLLKNFGASEYLLNKYAGKGEIGSLIGEMVAPPLNVVDGLVGIFTDPSDIDNHLKHMPLFGKMWYYYMGDGLKRLQKRRETSQSSGFTESLDMNLDFDVEM